MSVENDTIPRFSVVIPTYQRRDVVLASVRALAAQEGAASFEVIVAVDGSKDGTAEALRALEMPFPLAVIEQSNQGGAAARNRGADAARGEFLLFLDDDMEAHPRLLSEHSRSYREGADVVIGHIPLHPESPPGFLATAVGAWAEQRAHALGERRGELELHDLLTGQMSLRREVFLGLGGFDTRFTRGGTFGGEDLDLGRRLLDAGYRIAFNPEAISWQRYVVTPRQYLRQWHQSGRSSVMLARVHPDQAERIFRRYERRSDRYILRWFRPALRELVLALAAAGAQGPRSTHWFYRVRNLEYFRGIRDAGGPPKPRPVRVLCYHSIADLAGARILEPYGIPPRMFRRQLRFLARHFRFIGAEEFVRYLRGAGVPPRAILLSFDDCFQDLLDAAVPILRELHVPALAFAVTGRPGATNEWDAHLGAPQLPLLDAAGLRALPEAAEVALGSHTRTHRMLNRLSASDLSDEIEGSMADLETLGLDRPSFLAYPYGEHNPEVRRAVATAGFAGAFTVEPGLVRPGQDLYAIPRIEILRRDTGWRFVWKVVRAGRWSAKWYTKSVRDPYNPRRRPLCSRTMNEPVGRFLAPHQERAIEPGDVPTISVIIAAYQSAETIAETVASVLNQTVPPFEVIVCDDGSTDDVEAALAPYRDRVVLLRMEHRGAAAASNHALRVATGEFVIRVDSDDVLLPECLEALSELAASRPDLDLVSTDVYFEVDGAIVGRFYEENRFADTDQRTAILERCFVGWPAVRRARLLSVGGFDESLVNGSDWDAWIRLILDGGQAGLVQEPLLRYRVRAGSLSSNRTRSLQARIAVLDKTARNPNLRPEERRALASARHVAGGRALLAEVREGLLEHRSDVRRRALALAIAPGILLRTRLLGLGVALLPGLGARLYARRRAMSPVYDERAPRRPA